jgi:hypothetical protein
MDSQFALLNAFLSSDPQPPTLSAQRASARDKLGRLSAQQFDELATDVYDELSRRQNTPDHPFLPVSETYHPKRNQARQKLATLPANRFRDLASDVHAEMTRRYPQVSRAIPVPIQPLSPIQLTSPVLLKKGPVTAGSLDNLISDLGNMVMAPTLEATPITESYARKDSEVLRSMDPFQKELEEERRVTLFSLDGCLEK